MAQDYSRDHEDEDKGKGPSFKDFDCPVCNANNPVDEPFSDGAEIRCNYCGLEFKVQILDGGRLKFREI